MRPERVTGRRRKAVGAPTCWPSSTPRPTGSARSPTCWVRLMPPDAFPQRRLARSGSTGATCGSGPGRAVVEGVVCGVLDGLDALAAAGVPSDAGRLFLVGGGARSAAFRSVLAGLAQRQVSAVAGETVARGACRQAAAVLLGGLPEWA